MSTALGAVIYCRASADKSGKAMSVGSQERACRALAKSRGWAVIEVVVENNVSATRSKARPGLDRVIELVEDGRAAWVVVTEQSRLARRSRDLVRVLDACRATGAKIATTTQGDLDPSSAAGTLLSQVIGAVAESEALSISERTRRGLDAALAEGRPHGGPRPYGYTDSSRAEQDPAEAAAIRKAAAALLSGESLRSVVRDLVATDAPTPRRGSWTPQGLRAILLGPGIAGLRANSGSPVPGTWEPIIERDEWDAVVRLLTDPSRKTTHGTTPRHLLTRRALCSSCGYPVEAKRAPRTEPEDNKFVYRCVTTGCSKHVTIARDATDAIVREVVVARLSRKDASRLFTSAPDIKERSALTQKLADLDRREREAGRMFAEGALPPAVLSEVVRTVAAERDATEAALGRLAGDSSFAGLPVGRERVEAWWDGLSMERQRAVLDALFVAVRVHPAERGSNRVDPSRVTVDWRK